MPAAVALAALCAYVWHALAIQARFGFEAVDDAYISFRYLDNLLRGHGLVYNPGEAVEGYSNLLWILLLWPGAALGLEIPELARWLGLVLGAAALLFALHALRSSLGVRGVGPALFAAGLVAGSGYYAAWAMAGLESALHALLLLACWARFAFEQRQRSRFPLSAGLLAALALTRPEGLLVALGATVFHVAYARAEGVGWRARELWGFPLLLGVLLLAWEGYRVAQYGWHLWPNSVRAKVGLDAAVAARGARYVAAEFLLPYAPLLLPGCLVWRWRRDLPLALGAALFVGCVLFVAAAGGDWSHGRFFAPLLPLGAIVLAASASRLAAELDLGGVARRTAFLVGLLYVGIAGLVSHGREAGFLASVAGHDAERVAIGRWLARVAPPETRLGVTAAGQVPFYSRLYTHDMLGLTDPRVAERAPARLGRGTPGHERLAPAYTLLDVRPEVLIDPPPRVRRHPEFRRSYRRLEAFRRTGVYAHVDAHPALAAASADR